MILTVCALGAGPMTRVALAASDGTVNTLAGQKAAARLSRSRSIGSRAFSRRGGTDSARSAIVDPGQSPRSMRA